MKKAPFVKRFALFMALLFCSSMAVLGQTTVTGLVEDAETGEKLFGASVVLKNTTIGITTDFDGKFELTLKDAPPLTLTISFVGYDPQEATVNESGQKLKIRLAPSAEMMEVITVTESRLTEKQKESPLTVESLDAIAVKETPAVSFYDGLGSLKGVDLTAASMGFKIVNTRGFNSTRPVRSLQTIDGVDNQAPGLNFSVGNFAGSSELDVQRVELVVGASSAIYGPNAFNGVIDMTTKSPFLHKGFSYMWKRGERGLFEVATRYATAIQNKAGKDKFGFKLNFAYMEANDWEADNLDPTEDSRNPINQLSGYDAINRYGDEYYANYANEWYDAPGLGDFYRSGYNEPDLVDYNTENIKAATALHFKLTDKTELITAYNFGTGTTVYQGDNRYSLKGLKMHQMKLEVKQKDKFSVRAYHTRENAGESYDAVFTSLIMQELAKPNDRWADHYANYWRQNIRQRIHALPGYPDPDDPQYTASWFGETRPATIELATDVMEANADSLLAWHAEARAHADSPVQAGYQDFFAPGTARFDSIFNSIIGRKTFLEGGSGFYDKSSLSHIQAEYQFNPDWLSILVGGSFRLYTPQSEGTIFSDTLYVDEASGDTLQKRITNYEYGFFTQLQKRVLDEKLILTATARLDKNENFDFLVSPAASVVYKLNKDNIFRTSFSSAIRNPTLQDQFLYYNVGRALLIGNIEGVDSLIDIDSFIAYIDGNFNPDSLIYFNSPPVRPEKVKSLEFGYKGTLFNSLFIDASYYYSWYKDFLGYNLGLDVKFDDFSGLPLSRQAYRVSANSRDQVTTQGFSIGLNYYFAKYLSLSGNYSWNKLDRKGSDDPIIPAFNTPEHKFNIGISGRDIILKLGNFRLKNWGFNVNYKWIQGFVFEGSPQFTGFVPTYDMLDAQINCRIPRIKTTFKLGASNLLNQKNFHTYGGPRIGRMGYFQVLVELDDLH